MTKHISIIQTRIGYRPVLFEQLDSSLRVLSVGSREKTQAMAVSAARDWASDLKVEYIHAVHK